MWKCMKSVEHQLELTVFLITYQIVKDMPAIIYATADSRINVSDLKLQILGSQH